MTDDTVVFPVSCRDEFLDLGPVRGVLDVDRQNLISSSLKVDVCAIVEEIPSRHSRDMELVAYMSNLLKRLWLCLLQA